MATLFDIVTRHQIYLEGVKNGFGNTFETRFASSLRIQLQKLFATLEYEDLGDLTKKELNALLRQLIEINKTEFGLYTSYIISAIEDFMIVDREVSEVVLKDDNTIIPFLLANKLLWSRISNAPMGATGVNIMPTLIGFASMSAKQIENLLVKAWVNGDKAADFLKALIGTKSANYLDGEIGKIVRSQRAIVGTVIQHVSSEVQHSIGQAFYDEYMWSSIIDNSTTDVCRNRNGQIYRYGKGPIPPAHIGCRSKIVPISNAQLRPVNPSFQVWADGQPSAFVKDAFRGKPSEKVFPPLTIRQFGAKAKLMQS